VNTSVHLVIHIHLSRCVCACAASGFGRVKVVGVLLDAKADLERGARTTGGAALYHAAMQGSLDVLELLLERRADVNSVNTSLSGNLRTPLMIAVFSGHTECAKALVKAAGLDANARDSESMTALHYCARMGNVEGVRYGLHVYNVVSAWGILIIIHASLSFLSCMIFILCTRAALFWH
jgi:ankyrin repeat protein